MRRQTEWRGGGGLILYREYASLNATYLIWEMHEFVILNIGTMNHMNLTICLIIMLFGLFNTNILITKCTSTVCIAIFETWKWVQCLMIVFIYDILLTGNSWQNVYLTRVDLTHNNCLILNIFYNVACISLSWVKVVKWTINRYTG